MTKIAETSESPAAADAEDGLADTRPTIQLQPGRQKRVRAGHPWVFSNEIVMTADAKKLPPGGMVRLVDSAGGPVGTAMFNPHPLISARLLSRDGDAEIDGAFLERRIARAVELRDRLFDAPYYRLIWAEADGLPGLVADRYGDTIVLQANTAGIDRLVDEIADAIDRVLSPNTILLRADSPARRMEGLEGAHRNLKGALSGPVELIENGVRFLADPEGGQKTGWFYDHRDNRAFAASLSKDKRVLDAFSYLGGFGVQAAVAGAAEVMCIDRSEAALALAGEAARLNGVDASCRFVDGDAFDVMGEMIGGGEKFDVVIVDPPAFVKSKKDLGQGQRAYRKMVRMAANLSAPGGILCAASCSYHVGEDAFAEVIRGGLREAKRSGRILRRAGAGPDHPIHPYLPESAYLTCTFLQLD